MSANGAIVEILKNAAASMQNIMELIPFEQMPTLKPLQARLESATRTLEMAAEPKKEATASAAPSATTASVAPEAPFEEPATTFEEPATTSAVPSAAPAAPDAPSAVPAAPDAPSAVPAAPDAPSAVPSAAPDAPDAPSAVPAAPDAPSAAPAAPDAPSAAPAAPDAPSAVPSAAPAAAPSAAPAAAPSATPAAPSEAPSATTSATTSAAPSATTSEAHATTASVAQPAAAEPESKLSTESNCEETEPLSELNKDSDDIDSQRTQKGFTNQFTSSDELKKAVRLMQSKQWYGDAPTYYTQAEFDDINNSIYTTYPQFRSDFVPLVIYPNDQKDVNCYRHLVSIGIDARYASIIFSKTLNAFTDAEPELYAQYGHKGARIAVSNNVKQLKLKHFTGGQRTKKSKRRKGPRSRRAANAFFQRAVL